MKRHLYLAGFRGTGKSAVGRELSARLARPLVDLDAEVQRMANRSIAEIFGNLGEPEFRRLESEALASVSDLDRAAVVSLGGGAVLRPENRDLIRRTGVCVLLSASAETIAARIQADAASAAQRPALTDLAALEEIRHLLAARRSVYESVADLRIETDNRDIAAIVEQIASSLSAGSDCSGGAARGTL